MHLHYASFVLLGVVLIVAFAGVVVAQTPQLGEKPTPSIGPKIMFDPAPVGSTPTPPKVVLPQIQGAPPLINSWKGLDFNDNMTNAKFSYVDRMVEPGKTYRYFIGAVDKDGEFFSPTREVSIPAMATALRQNEPNPFNPTTTIAFTLPGTQHVSLVVYDASGRVVKRLVSGVQPFGPHRIVWDGTDNNGHDVTSGVYFYRLHTGSFVESKKMVLVK